MRTTSVLLPTTAPPVSPVSACPPAAQTSPTRTWTHIPAAQARFIRNTRSAIDSGQRVDLFNDWTAIRPSFPVLEEVEGAAGTFEQNMKKAASTYEHFGGTTGLGSLAPTPFAVGAKEGQLGHAKGGGGGGNGAGNVGERAASTRATSCLGPIAGSLASGAASKKTTVNVGTSVPLVLVATSTPPRPSPPPAAAAAVPAATILSLLSSIRTARVWIPVPLRWRAPRSRGRTQCSPRRRCSSGRASLGRSSTLSMIKYKSPPPSLPLPLLLSFFLWLFFFYSGLDNHLMPVLR